MKLKFTDETIKLQTNAIQKLLDQNHEVLIYVICNKCKKKIMNKVQAPFEILEMSFFKFLEQFFYN